MNDHDHDEAGNCIPPQSNLYPGGLPTWRFSPWDVVGIALTGLGGLLMVGGQAANLLSREFTAMANYSRREYELHEAQREYDAEQERAAEDLRRLLAEGPS